MAMCLPGQAVEYLSLDLLSDSEWWPGVRGGRGHGAGGSSSLRPLYKAIVKQSTKPGYITRKEQLDLFFYIK